MSRLSEPILYSNEAYEIRPARSLDEFRDVWWKFMQELGWNRGCLDLETYMNPSIGYGMILLIEKKTKKPVGHVSAVINSNSTGWVSLFIIDEAHRGQGMGGELFKAAMADFERNGTGIKGLDDGRRGFRASPLGDIKIMLRNLVAKDPLPIPAHRGHIVNLRRVSQNLLVLHELKFDRPDVLGVALVDNSDPQSVEDIHGWAVMRRCSKGVRVGPLYAMDASSAEAVLAAIAHLATPEYIKSIPLPNEPMNDWSDEQIVNDASIVVELWTGNPEATVLFEKCARKGVDSGFNMAHCMWVDGKATPEHSQGGLAQTGVFAIFDAAVG